MNLVDSSGWLEYFAGDKNAKDFAPILENSDELIVSVISIYEVYKILLKQCEEDVALNYVALMHQAKIINVNSEISIEAVRATVKYKIPMADSIIYTTGILNDAIIWTQDYDFINLPNVKFIKK